MDADTNTSTISIDAKPPREPGGPWAVTPAALKRMARYEWPGNVRELVNSLERARVLAVAVSEVLRLANPEEDGVLTSDDGRFRCRHHPRSTCRRSGRGTSRHPLS